MGDLFPRGAVACNGQPDDSTRGRPRFDRDPPEIRPRFAGPAAGKKGMPQAKRGVGCPHLRYSEDGTHSRHSKNRRPYSLSRFPSPFCIVLHSRYLTERCARDLQGPPQAKRARRRRNGVWGVPTFAIVKTALFSFQIPFALGVARYLPDICLQSASVILQPTRCSGPGVRACVRVLAGVRLLKTNHTVYRQARKNLS